MKNDYVAYCDTDSLFVKCKDFLFDNGMTNDIWEQYSEEERVGIILNLSSIIESYVNECSFEETQKGCYNSQVKRDEFTITFKQEIVCKSALFIKKKKYGFWLVNKEHVPCDEIAVTGLDIIRSETPRVFREALREMLTLVLKNADPKEILDIYNMNRKVSRKVNIEDISENKGVKGLSKYIQKGEPIKGTPYHVKAVANYHKMLKWLNLENKYPEILDDSKNKLIFLKPNSYGIKCLMYDEWPKELQTNLSCY
jgi:DNA polymerase elongation subunit (family B)